MWTSESFIPTRDLSPIRGALRMGRHVFPLTQDALQDFGRQFHCAGADETLISNFLSACAHLGFCASWEAIEYLGILRDADFHLPEQKNRRSVNPVPTRPVTGMDRHTVGSYFRSATNPVPTHPIARTAPQGMKNPIMGKKAISR